MKIKILADSFRPTNFYGLFILILLGWNNLAIGADNPDPLEKVNRVSFWITDKADQYVLRPVAVGYTRVTPDWVESRISNFFANLQEPQFALNSLLQLKLSKAGRGAGRFLINSSVGLAGFFDVANAMGIEVHDEDFGQTLGHWGISSGPYIFIPLLGPSSARDLLGFAVDTPTRPTPYVDHVPTRNSLFAMQQIDSRSQLLEFESLVMGDKYIFMRDFYLNHRKKLVADGVPEVEFDESDFEDEFDFEDDD